MKTLNKRSVLIALLTFVLLLSLAFAFVPSNNVKASESSETIYIKGAQVYSGENADKSAIRFVAGVNKTWYTDPANQDKTITFGMLIAPDKGEDLTTATANVKNFTYNSIKENTIDGDLEYMGDITYLLDDTFWAKLANEKGVASLTDSEKAEYRLKAHSMDLVARPYYKIDGGEPVYGEQIENARSIRNVVNRYRNDADVVTQAVKDKYLTSITDKDTAAKGYFVTDGTSSKLFSSDIPDGDYDAYFGTKSLNATVVNSVITINGGIAIDDNEYVALFDDSNNVYNIPFTAITTEQAEAKLADANTKIEYTNNDISWAGSADTNIEYTVKVGDDEELSMFNKGYTVPLGRGESTNVTVTPKIGALAGTPSTVKVYGELDITLDGTTATVTEVDDATTYKAYINGSNWYDDKVNTRNYSNHLDGTMLHYKVVTPNGTIMSEKIAYNRYNANNFITNVDDGNGVAVGGNASKYTIVESTTQKHSGEKSLKITVNESDKSDAYITIVVPEELTFDKDVILSYWVYVESMSSSDATANGVVSAWTQVTHNAAPTPLSHKNYKTSAGILKQMDTAVGYIPKGSWVYVSYRIQLKEDSYIDGTSGKRVIQLVTDNLNWYNGQGVKESSARKSITMYIDDIALQTGDYNASWTLSASQFTYNLKKYMYVDGTGLSGAYYEDGLDTKSAMAYTSGTTFTTADNNKTGNTAYDEMQRILFLNHGEYSTVAQAGTQNTLIQQVNWVRDGQLAGTTVEMYVYCDTETAFAFVEANTSDVWSFDKVQVVPAKTWTKITYTYEFTETHKVIGVYLAQVGSLTGGASAIKFDGIRIYR